MQKNRNPVKGGTENGYLTILVGIPASGKSTIANKWVEEDRSGRTVQVERDQIREKFFTKSGHRWDYKFSRKMEKKVTIIQHSLIESYLKQGYHVIVSDTNLNDKTRTKLVPLAEGCGSKVLVKPIDCEFTVAMSRNRNRPNRVPDHIMWYFYSTFMKYRNNGVPDASVIVPHQYKMDAIVVDIDGTFVKMSPDRGPFEWDKVTLDTPNDPVVELVKRYQKTHEILFCSGRDGVCYDDTHKHIVEILGNNNFELFMRPEGSQDPDHMIKKTIYDLDIEPTYNVHFVLDDRQQVVDMWRSLGITCFQVDYGDF